MIIGLGLNYAGLDAIKLLFTATVVNGLLAPPLILIVVLLSGDRRVMGDAVSFIPVTVLGWIAFAVMVLAGLGLIVAS